MLTTWEDIISSLEEDDDYIDDAFDSIILNDLLCNILKY